MFRCEGLKVVTVEVFATHPIWVFSLLFHSGQPLFKVEFSIEFSTQINPCLDVRV